MEGKGDARFEIGPVDHKLGHILHHVFDIKMVPVGIVIHGWPMPGIKLDAIDVVPRLESRASWYLSQFGPAGRGIR